MYTKTGKVHHRIIRYNNIIEIASFFEMFYEKENGRCTFSITFRDNSFVSVQSKDFFESTHFKHKDVSRIHFEYVSNNYSNKIALCLEESRGLFTGENVFEVVSLDEDWLNSSFIKMNDLIAGIAKRSVFRKALSFPWICASYLLFHVICAFGMYGLGFVWSNRPVLSNGQPDSEVLFFSIYSYTIMVTVLFMLITAIVHLLLPEQEFAFGVKRHPRRTKVRKAIKWIIVSIIIPIMLSNNKTVTKNRKRSF